MPHELVPEHGPGVRPVRPEHAVIYAGAGVNRIYVDGERDLGVVVRWLDGEAYDGFIERVLEAVE